MRVSVSAFAAVGVALVALSACQDPSTVGLGLIDEDASNPNLRVLAATAVDTVGYEVSTSGFANVSPVQSRVLVGSVADPLYGDAESRAYIDAVAPTLPDGFEDNPVTGVTLELRRDYVYGDTTAVFPVELRQVTGAWAPVGLPSDTTLGTGDLLSTTTVNARDSLTVFALPASWVTANGALFTSESFSSTFEGFELRAAPGSGAVLGFDVTPDADISVLRVATAEDTVEFRLSEVYSRLTRGTPGLAPMGRRLLRAGSGEGLKASFSFASVLQLPLAQAVFRLPLDRSLAGAQGTFLRPLAPEVALFATPTTGVPLFVTAIRTAGPGDARSAPASTALTPLVQGILLEQASYRQFEVRFQVSPLSLDVLPVALDGATLETQPRFSLTVVGQST
ncbi:MAG TPA: hypothetical protein VF576_03795 [Rubricoccaceae bacterium]